MVKYMGLKQSEKSELTRERILAAAEEEFSEKGFYGARIDSIAAASGMNKRMIYAHFDSKEKLYTLKKYEVESDEFGFDDKYIPFGDQIYKYGYVDVSDLSNCKMFITRILNQERGLKQQYTYVVFDIQKETDSVYCGKMMYSPDSFFVLGIISSCTSLLMRKSA